jgi:hypothetical protein
MKRTGAKVEVHNGTKIYIRTVYKDNFGNFCFKDGGEWNCIFKKDDGTYTAPYYNSVEIMKG